jgi:beta-phosphoglucomutase
MKRAALFDLDGTIVDNMSFHAEAWVRFAAARGAVVTADEVIKKHGGKKSAEVLSAILGRTLSDAEVAGLAEEKESAYRALYAARLSPVHGVVPFLDALARRGVACGIASAAPKQNRDLVLDGLRLRGSFQTVVGPEHVAKGKPAPDLFLAAARNLNVEPSACVVFEDAVNGVLAGIAAGCRVVAITTTHDAEELRRAGAHVVAENFSVLEVDTLFP